MRCRLLRIGLSVSMLMLCFSVTVPVHAEEIIDVIVGTPEDYDLLGQGIHIGSTTWDPFFSKLQTDVGSSGETSMIGEVWNYMFDGMEKDGWWRLDSGLNGKAWDPLFEGM